jgi:hypothetical protein
MATTLTAHRAHHGLSVLPKDQTTNQKARGTVAIFFSDLLEDVVQKPLQAAKFAKHDMFREHINAMSISYFALIVLLIAGSVPLLGWAVQNLVNY